MKLFNKKEIKSDYPLKSHYPEISDREDYGFLKLIYDYYSMVEINDFVNVCEKMPFNKFYKKKLREDDDPYFFIEEEKVEHIKSKYSFEKNIENSLDNISKKHNLIDSIKNFGKKIKYPLLHEKTKEEYANLKPILDSYLINPIKEILEIRKPITLGTFEIKYQGDKIIRKKEDIHIITPKRYIQEFIKKYEQNHQNILNPLLELAELESVK